MNAAALITSDAPDLSRLRVWQEVSSFSQVVDTLDGQAKRALLFDRRLRPLQEALVLRDFALTLGYAQCRLCPPDRQFPDGEVADHNGIVKVEITEVMEPGRRRDEEYKLIESNGLRPKLSHIEQEELRVNGIGWPGWFLDAVHRKMKYGPGAAYDIVVNNNIHVFSLPELPAVAAAVQTLMAERGFRAHRVWHYQSTRIHQLHPQFMMFDIPDARSRF